MNKKLLQTLVSIIDERSFQRPGIALICTSLAALAAELTTRSGGTGAHRSEVVFVLADMASAVYFRITYNSAQPAVPTAQQPLCRERYVLNLSGNPLPRTHTAETLRQQTPWFQSPARLGHSPGTRPAAPFPTKSNKHIYYPSQECNSDS